MKKFGIVCISKIIPASSENDRTISLLFRSAEENDLIISELLKTLSENSIYPYVKVLYGYKYPSSFRKRRRIIRLNIPEYINIVKSRVLDLFDWTSHYSFQVEYFLISDFVDILFKVLENNYFILGEILSSEDNTRYFKRMSKEEVVKTMQQKLGWYIKENIWHK